MRQANPKNGKVVLKLEANKQQYELDDLVKSEGFVNISGFIPLSKKDGTPCDVVDYAKVVINEFKKGKIRGDSDVIGFVEVCNQVLADFDKKVPVSEIEQKFRNSLRGE